MRDGGVLRSLTPREADRDTNGDLSTMDSTLLVDAKFWLPLSKEFTAGTYQDASTNAFDGTQGTAGARGDMNPTNGGVIHLDGGDDWIDVDAIGSIPEIGTIMFWCNIDTFTTFDTVFSWQEGADDFMIFYVSAASEELFFRFQQDNVDEIFFIDTPLATATWTHITVTWTDNDAKYYTNGVISEVDTTAALDPFPTGQGYIGWWGTSTRYWDGYIDDFRLYDRVITSNEQFSVYISTTNTYGVN